MQSWHWAIMLKPLIAVLIMLAIVLPIKWIFWKLIPEGKLKRILFFSWKV